MKSRESRVGRVAQVAVAFGGPSPEHDISILTGLQAALSLVQDGQDVICLYWTKSGRWQRVSPMLEAAEFLNPDIEGAVDLDFSLARGFVERRRRRSQPLAVEVVLNCCHGPPGEDGSLAALMQLAGICVTGPSPSAAALAMDKLSTTSLAQSIGIPSIPTIVWPPSLDPGIVMPEPPWIVKPRWGGSSIDIEAGVEDVETVEALANTGTRRAGMLVQSFLDGWIDLNVAVRTHPTVVCSAVERPLRGNTPILGYQDKYLSGDSGTGMDFAPRELPADIPQEIHDSIRQYSIQLIQAMGLTGAPRVDYLWDGDRRILMCEVNPIPGAWANHLWQEIGISRLALYEGLIDEALASPSRPLQWSGSSDGRALRASGEIARKLI